MKITSQLAMDFGRQCNYFKNAGLAAEDVRKTNKGQQLNLTDSILEQMVEEADCNGVRTDVDELRILFKIPNGKKTIVLAPTQTPIARLASSPALLASISNGNGFHEAKFIPGNNIQNVSMLSFLIKNRFYDLVQFSIKKTEAPIIRHFDIRLLEVQNPESSIIFKFEDNIILKLENGSILFTPSKVQIV